MAKISFSEATRAGRSKRALVPGLVVTAAAALAASLLVLAAATRPAEAAFPGPAGAIAYTCCDQGNLDVWRMAPDGFGATRLTDNAAYDSQPAFSSEGTQIAFNSLRDDFDGTGDWDIYRMYAAGNNENQLTRDAPTANTVDDVEPYWFPNDAKIAFRRDEVNPANANIWVLTLDENGTPTGEQRLTTHAASDVLPAVSPDGKLIAFASNRDGDWEIYVMNADGTKQKNLTRNTGLSDIDPVFSPDGRKISFERSNPAFFSRDIFRMRSDGTHHRNLTENFSVEANPSWQPVP